MPIPSNGLLKDLVSISRLQSGVGVQKGYAAHATGVACMIQPFDDEEQNQYDLAFGQGFTFFFDISVDIQNTDKLTDADGKVYVIVGIEKFNFGRWPHYEVLATVEKN